MQDIQTATDEKIATAENKPNVSFPRDSQVSLGMTESEKTAIEQTATDEQNAIERNKNEQTEINAELTVESGVEPLKFEYQAVYRAGEEKPKAFISRVTISGLPYGSFLPESYEQKIENISLGAHLTARLIKRAAKKIDLLLQNNPQAELDFIALPAYNAFLLLPDLYGELQNLLKDYPREVYSKICLIINENAFKPLQKCSSAAENKPNVSFPRDSSATLGMTENKTLGMTPPRCHVEQAKRVETSRGSAQNLNGNASGDQTNINVNEKITDVKAFGLKTMISGFGKSDFPVTSLIGVEADYVGVSEETAALLNDRNAKESAMALMRFAATTGAAVVVNGIETDEQIRSLFFGDCYGYTAKAGFVGMDGEKGGYLGEDEAFGLIGGGEQ